VPELVSWERAVCGGGGAPALAATLPPATDDSAGRYLQAAPCSRSPAEVLHTGA
jgi:hypothetical protein